MAMIIGAATRMAACAPAEGVKHEDVAGSARPRLTPEA